MTPRNTLPETHTDWMTMNENTDNGWLPIETAPKDGREILGCLHYEGSPRGCPVVISWWPGGDHTEPHWSASRSGHEYGDALTHWHPLPPLPVNAEGRCQKHQQTVSFGSSAGRYTA